MGTETQLTTVLDLIQRWVDEQPDHEAVYIGTRRVSYRQLDDAATRIACLLLQKNVRAGDFVPVLATRGVEMIACFLGVLKAGACYVPIDIEAWSEQRVAWTMETVSARVVLNLGATPYPEYDTIPCSVVQAAFESWAATSVVHLDEYRRRRSELQPGHLAYMIFTSGTTSTPKGVMIAHSALLHYALQGDDETPYNCNAKPDDAILLIFSPGFDACVGVVFSALCGGAKLLISSADDLLECASRSTILVATPSVLAALGEPEQTCPNVKTIILGGEAPPPSLVEKWWTPNRNIFNAYGLTETTIMSTIGRVLPGKPITLGRPMANTRTLLLDGEIESDDYGELCITGPGLALGYFQNETLTAQKFIMWKGERLYRTGDYARRAKNGLEFAGRADSLVKNRGFLVNLETQVIPMLLAGGAATATAFMFQKQLFAFVTPKYLDVLELRHQLAGQFDDYMVPDQIRAVDALPLTTNGKADNRALQRLLEQEDEGIFLDEDSDHPDHLDRSNESKMKILQAAVAIATSLPSSQVTGDQSFWELGGNSLAAVKVISFLRKRRLTVGVKALFGLPNLSAVCAVLQDESDASDETAQEGVPTSGPMTSLQVKMVQGMLKSPGLNYMMFRILMPLVAGLQADPARIRSAWHRVLQRHSIFRTTFCLKDELQEIRPEIDLDWQDEVSTLDHLESVIQERSRDIQTRLVAVDDQMDKFRPVNVLRLVSVPGVSSTLLLSVHHAQVDGWSLSIVLGEVQAALANNSATDSHTSPLQFTTVALAQQQQQIDPLGMAYWDQRLDSDHSILPRLDLPKPQKDTDAGIRRGWMDQLTMPLSMSKISLEDAGRRFRVVPSTLIYAAWSLMLSNYTSSDRTSFGAVLSGRNLTTKTMRDVEHVVGPLLNTVPFPIQFGDETQTIAGCVEAIHKDVMDTVEYQWSANEIMSKMGGESISNAMQTIVVTEYDVPPMRGSWSVQSQDLMLEFGLSLLVEKDKDDNLKTTILFDNARFANTGIQRLALHFRNALREFMNPSNTHVQDVRARLLSDDERGLLIRAPATTEPYQGPKTLKDALDLADTKWPDLCALESKEYGTMTYRQLHEASNRLARQLRRHMQRKSLAKEDAVVCVLTDRSLPWIIGILAVIKAGGICCPLDVTLPARRIEKIVETSGTSIFLSANANCTSAIDFRRDTSAGRDDTVITIDQFLKDSAKLDGSPLENITETEDIVYLVFTSGTSGTPKGVPLHNRSILHVINVPSLRLFAAPGRRIAQLTSAGFDIVMLEMFGTLCYGATLVMKDPGDPFEHLKRVHATNLTPSVLGALLPEDYSHLDMIALAGEPVPQPMADTWGVGRDLRNVYGPSECGPVSTTVRLLPGKEVTIGPSLPRLSAYVLDHRMCPVPQGITGEIYLSGDQVTRGYWKDSGRNQNRHIKNLFSTAPGMDVMYRTGDLGSWDEDMTTLRYAGRIDHQVKVRGFRVELEEVEQALLAADLPVRVKSAVAIVVDNEQQGGQGDKRIVGVVTPENVDVSALRSQLVAVLPSYMRPSQVLALPVLPRSGNGKADRAAITALAISSWSHSGEVVKNTDLVEIGGGPQTALTATELLISEVWKKLLKLGETTPVRKDDDFLAIGGNSILAIKAARMITSSIGHHIPLALLVRKTVLEDLAEAIDEKAAKSSSAVKDDVTFSTYRSSAVTGTTQTQQPSNILPLSYLEEELFYSHHASDTKSAFNTVFQFVARGRLNKPALFEAIRALVRENSILRSRYVIADGRPCRLISDREFNPTGHVGDEWSKEKTQALLDEPFDLANDHLLRFLLWDRGGDDGETEVTLIMHHIVTDRASIGLIMKWISQRYLDVLGQGEEASVKYGRNSSQNRENDYLDWAHWLQKNQFDSRSQAKLQKKLSFWRQYLQDIKPLPKMAHPTSGSHHGSVEKNGQHSGSTRHFFVPPPPKDSPTTTPAAYSQRLAVAAVALVLKAVLGTSDITLALPHMNRDDAATADMLGLFVDRVPIRVSMADQNNLASAEALLDAVASATLRAIENYVPYRHVQAAVTSGTNKESLATATSYYYEHFFHVLVIYNWQADALERAISFGPDVQVRSVDTADAAKVTGAMFPLLFNCTEQSDGGLVVEVESNPDIVLTHVVDELVKFLPQALQGLVCCTRPDDLLLALGRDSS